MTARDLAVRLQAETAAGKWPDFGAVRKELHGLSQKTTDVGERVILLQVHRVLMDLLERSGAHSPEQLKALRTARAQDYRLLLLNEVLIGVNVSAELLNAVTQREVMAGRMAEDDELRQAALKGISEPYLTVQELSQIEQERVAAQKPKGWRGWLGRK